MSDPPIPLRARGPRPAPEAPPPERPAASIPRPLDFPLDSPLDFPGGEPPIDLVLELEGERVLGVEARPGRTHRGFEKQVEAGHWYHAIPYVERLADHCGIAPSVAYCAAVERLLAVEVPPRAQWLRVLACELARVVEHASRLAATCAAVEADVARARALALRELAWDPVEALCGARVTPHYPRIGGVRHDAPDDFARALHEAVAAIRSALEELVTPLRRDPVFLARLRDVAVLPPETLLAWGATGPLLRAAGVAADLRRDRPYLTYAELDFDVATGSVGDDLDRFLVVVEEVRQSLRIVEQAADRLVELEGAPVDVDDPRVRWPAKDEVHDHIEGLIHHFQGVTDGPRVPAGECYAAVEAPTGELGFYLVSDGGPRPVRLRCRPPSLFHAQLLPRLLEGQQLADVLPTLALAHIAAGELDR